MRTPPVVVSGNGLEPPVGALAAPDLGARAPVDADDVGGEVVLAPQE
jgi:hypothetical protein